jgi:hypothetical protein
VTATHFLVVRNLAGSPGKVYGGVLLATLTGVVIWMLWILTRYLTDLFRGQRAVRDGTYRVLDSDAPAAHGT